PDVTVADEVLFNYLDWLERTQVELEKVEEEKEKVTRIVGWPSDRLGIGRTIHLATTAFSINALLDLYDLVEYRLWQLCQQRFPAVLVQKGLIEIDPVDLGLPHAERLHSFLNRMAVATQEADFNEAEYSLVLHGPPRSSKTKLAEGLSAEMWKDCT